MALLKMGSLVVDARGSVGGVTFARNRGGAYARARVAPLNPASVRQVAVRSTLASLAAQWSNTLTGVQRTAWELYASNVPLINSLGEPRNVSGQNMFIRTNQLVLDCGGAVVTAAPTNFTVGPTITPTLVPDVAADQVDMTAWPGFVNPAAGTYMLIQQGTPQNAGVNFFKGPFRKIYGALIITPGNPLPKNDVPLAYPIVAGQAVFFRTIAITIDGRVGVGVVQRFLV